MSANSKLSSKAVCSVAVKASKFNTPSHWGSFLARSLANLAKVLVRARPILTEIPPPTSAWSSQTERLTEAYLAEVVGLEGYKRRRAEIESRQQSLEEQVRSLESQTQQHLEVAGIITSIGDFCQRMQSGLGQATFSQKWQLVKLLIDRVIIAGGGRSPLRDSYLC